MLLLAIYRPPKHIPSFLPEVSELFSICCTNYDKILISGDFNFHIDNPLDSKAREFLQLLLSLDFIQLVVEPTHNCGHTLDLVVSRGLDIYIDEIVDCGLSDHYSYHVFFNLTTFLAQLKIIQS